MNGTVTVIPLSSLALSFVPLAAVLAVLVRWSVQPGTIVYASIRMTVQLVAIGYVLTLIFESEHVAPVLAVLAVMLLASAWIALRPIAAARRRELPLALLAIAVGALVTLAFVIGGVLRPAPWFAPRVVIPIAGMLFSTAMNTVSLAAERFHAERGAGLDYVSARKRALEAALIPLVNAFLAVGLVSLPGMMTGQILSGIEPHVAVRYQVMVMAMMFGASGIAAIFYLSVNRRI